MAVKRKPGANRAKASRKKTTKTMNQFATAARRKTKEIGRNAETAVENASEWVGDQASSVGAAMRRQPILTALIATGIGLAGWLVGRRAIAD